ncbi:MAG: hypothetical protein HKO13_02470 [Sphingomonas sp.]|nr:hypothetical protein [Sphingomonas sp.]
MNEDRAKGRFAVLMMMRLGGLVLALLGLLLTVDGAILDEGMPILGSIMVLGGILESYLVPRWLHAVWKHQD